MEPTLWQELYDYNFWANRRVWESIMALDEARFDKPLGGDRRSIRVQCIHILEVEYWWIHFLHTGVVEFLDNEKIVTRADVRAAWDDVEEKVKAASPFVIRLSLTGISKTGFPKEEIIPHDRYLDLQRLRCYL